MFTAECEVKNLINAVCDKIREKRTVGALAKEYPEFLKFLPKEEQPAVVEPGFQDKLIDAFKEMEKGDAKQTLDKVE